MHTGRASRFLPGEMPAGAEIARVVRSLFEQAATAVNAGSKPRTGPVISPLSIDMASFVSLAYSHVELGSWMRHWDSPGVGGCDLHPGPATANSTPAISSSAYSDGVGKKQPASYVIMQSADCSEAGVGESKVGEPGEAGARNSDERSQSMQIPIPQADRLSGVGRPKGVRPVAVIAGGAFQADSPSARPAKSASNTGYG